MTTPASTDGALRVVLDLWHPDCWVIRTTEAFDAGFLGYGIYTTGDRVTTLFTVYADERATIDAALDAAADSPHVHSLSELEASDRHAAAPEPGNATREVLVTHDGREQVSSALTSRGFVCASPIDMRDGREHWTLVTNHDRETVRAHLDEVEAAEDADITVRSMTRASWRTAMSGLPTDELTRRQREVFRLARERGYYEAPKETTAADLAAELDVSTSTLHEHLQKVEATLLGRDGPPR